MNKARQLDMNIFIICEPEHYSLCRFAQKKQAAYGGGHYWHCLLFNELIEIKSVDDPKRLTKCKDTDNEFVIVPSFQILESEEK